MRLNKRTPLIKRTPGPNKAYPLRFSSYHRIMKTWYHDIIISSDHHIIMPSYHHIIISSYHHVIISSYHHMIIWSYDHIIISANQKSASPFWPKSQEKNRLYHFYPSTKNHRYLNFWTSGVVFRDESVGNAQKITAPPNRHFTCFVMTFQTLQNLQTAKKSRG